MTTLEKDIIAKAKQGIEDAKENDYDLDSIDWGHQEGYLISYNDLERLIKLIENK